VVASEHQAKFVGASDLFVQGLVLKRGLDRGCGCRTSFHSGKREVPIDATSDLENISSTRS
jgi:hypothetical protein